MKLISMVFLLMFVGIHICQGQDRSFCDFLDQKAEALKTQLEIKADQNSQLRSELRIIRQKLIGKEIRPLDSTYYPLLHNTDRKFDEVRQWKQTNCFRQANPGIINVGEVVFWRTVNLENEVIQQSNLMAEKVKLESQLRNNGSRRQPDGYVHQTEGLFTQRPIFKGKTYTVAEVDPKALRIEISPGQQNPQAHAFGALSQTFSRPVIFAMNAGMFGNYREPVGLLIKNGRAIGRLNRDTRGYGNFYMQPNGVFYVDSESQADVVTTQEFVLRNPRLENIQTATQSGPMMITNGQINSAFTQGSQNVHFRNAVGVTRNGRVIFAISKQQVNFYEFASFLRKLGCVNALYLDGAVSRMYLPAIGETSALYDSNHLGPVFYILE